MSHACNCVILAAVFVLVPTVSPQTRTEEINWTTLKRLPNNATFAYRIRGQKDCTYGKLIRTTSESVTIKTETGQLVVSRANLQRIWDGLERNDFIYTTYSSWDDVKALHVSMNKDEYVQVVTRSGAKQQGRVVRVADSEIVMTSKNRETSIPRADIVIVEYVRLMPVGDDANYEARHGVFVRPETWPYALGIPPKLTVRLYDTAKPETLGPPGNCSWR